MNQHQECAKYIFGKMQQVAITGDESDIHTSAKQWLMLVVQGQLNVEEITDDKVRLVRDEEDVPDSAGGTG